MKNRSFIRLDEINKKGANLEYRFAYSKDLERFFSNKIFRIKYDIDISNIPDAILSIPFVSSVLPIVMVADVDLYVQEIDKDFFECVRGLASGYETMFPETRFLGKIIAKKIVETKTCVRGEKIAMFYSGGLDSVHTLISHAEEKPDLICVWGSDIKCDNEKGWNVLYGVLSEEAQKIDLPLLTIKSSFRVFDNENELDKTFSKQLKDGWWHGVKHGIALIGHVAPLAYVNGYKAVYIASSNSPQDKNVRCASNPATDSKIKFCKTRIVHDGYEYNRQEKAHRIVNYCQNNNINISLHVCWKTQTGGNCCICEKCYRTIFNLLVEGAEPEHYGFNKMNAFFKEFNHNALLHEISKKYNIQCEFYHIAERLRNNKKNIRKNEYWKYVKWLERLDINDLKSFEPSKLYLIFKMIKNYLRGFKYKINKIINFFIYFCAFVLKYRKTSVVLIGTPNHSNIGDLAITYAEKRMIEECGFIPFEITYSEAKYYFRLLKTLLKNKMIILHGGGNMGDTWFREELLRRSILREMRAKRFIIMPQTIYYSDTESGIQKERESIFYYNRNNVIMFLRDERSFKKAIDLYPDAEIYLSSDIVLSLVYENNFKARNKKALLVFRDDVEKAVDNSLILQIKEYLESRSIDYDVTDMYSLKKITKNNVDSIVLDKLKVFAEYSFVITDRLHGMIFSTITCTPCLAFNNGNKKVEGTYAFIKNQGYIFLCCDYEDFVLKMDKILTNDDINYKKHFLEAYYMNIKRIIKMNK